MEEALVLITDSGQSVEIEIKNKGVSSGNNVRGSSLKVPKSFEDAIAPLKSISNSLINNIKEIATSPDEVEIELGIKFSASAGIIITSIDSEAVLNLKLKWKKNISV